LKWYLTLISSKGEFMKKIMIFSLAFAVVSASAWAGFGLPKVNTGNSATNAAVNKGADMGKNKAVEKMINDKLAKEKCSFKNATTETDTTCDLNKIAKDLSNWKNGLEATLVNRVQVNVQADATKSDLAHKRVNFVRDQLKNQINWWDYNVSTNTAGNNDLKIWVSVR
jgi:hypothetical protein